LFNDSIDVHVPPRSLKYAPVGELMLVQWQKKYGRQWRFFGKPCQPPSRNGYSGTVIDHAEFLRSLLQTM